jgi:hypothetical protein
VFEQRQTPGGVVVIKVPKFSVFGWLAAVATAAVLLVAPAAAAVGTPVALMPAEGTTTDALPAFGWEPVRGAARYEWEISADPGFNSPVLGASYDHFFTRNTRATMTKVIPNGTYWWHVRAVTANGSVSPWSPARSFTKRWAPTLTLSAPANGATITFPSEPFRLAWQPVPGAARYLVSVATDPALGSLVWPRPVETQATSFTLASPLAPDQTYYWGITPLDASGNRGAASDVWSFTWRWPSETTPVVTDVADELEIYDHRFSWDRVPGAAGYQLEVNTSSDFAPGSKVCCSVNVVTNLTTIATSYSPKVVLQNNNSYYWRVRAIDPSGNAGRWNEGPPFLKAFDNVLPSVGSLRMLDNAFPSEPAYETDTPIVTWDPVPGASSYEVEVTPFVGGCQWSWSGTPSEHWRIRTATTAWTPLGWGWNGVKPYSSPQSVSTDIPRLVAGHSYCVRVTAIDRPSDFTKDIRSAEAYLPDADHPAFTWTGPPAGDGCSPDCSGGAVGSDDYLTPLRGEVKRSMPLFRWKPLAGYESYFVLVARDPEFTNLVDYAFTKLPAYAPRTNVAPRTYPDETTLYYWAVLPATGANGSGVTTAPRFSAPAGFHKQSLPPVHVAPADGTVFAAEPSFQWEPAEGARRYNLQVSEDPTFADTIENVITDSTAYTSSKTYRADVAIYWRVRADDELGTGLTWSQTGAFRKTLARPVVDADNPTAGDALPTWEWASVPGAVSYDIQVRHPDGRVTDIANVPSTAFTPTLMKGTGIWQWRVRANFPQAELAALTDGPWTAHSSFTRTIREPQNATENFASDHVVLRWDPKLGAFNYRVQVSTRPDFSTFVERTTTDNTAYAPRLTQYQYFAGGTFYWRVAAADDAVLNPGDFTAPGSFTLPPATAATKLATRITASVKKTARRVKVSGKVLPAHPGRRVVVTLAKKRNGAFVRLALKRPLIGSAGGYATSFARPRPGTCRITSRFPGDADHLASRKAVVFRC